MPGSGKMLRFTLIILVIFSLVLASAAAYLLQQQMQKTTVLNDKLNEALKQEKTVQSFLDTSKQEISRLNSLLTQSQEQIKALDEKLASAESEKNSLADTISNVSKQLADSQGKAAEYLKNMEDLKAKLEGEKKQLEIVSKEKQDLAGQLDKLQQKGGEGVRLEKIVVTPGQTGTVSVLSAKVVSVDKKLKFLIIDAGVKDSVNPGDIFTCLNNDKEIGTVRVNKVYDSLSAADFMPGLSIKFLKEGLKVIRK